MPEIQPKNVEDKIDIVTKPNRFYTPPPYRSVLAIRNKLHLDTQYYRMRYELRQRNKLFISENAAKNILQHDLILESLDTDGTYAYRSFLSSIREGFRNIKKYSNEQDYPNEAERMVALDGNTSDIIYYTHLALVTANHFHFIPKPDSQNVLPLFINRLERIMTNETLEKILSAKSNVWIHNILEFHGVEEYKDLRLESKATSPLG